MNNLNSIKQLRLNRIKRNFQHGLQKINGINKTKEHDYNNKKSLIIEYYLTDCNKILTTHEYLQTGIPWLYGTKYKYHCILKGTYNACKEEKDRINQNNQSKYFNNIFELNQNK